MRLEEVVEGPLSTIEGLLQSDGRQEAACVLQEVTLRHGVESHQKRYPRGRKTASTVFLEKLKKKKTMSHPVELQTLGLFCWLFVFCFVLFLLFSELLPNRRDHVNWLKSHQGKKFLCDAAESQFCRAPSPLEGVLKQEGTREETLASERVANKGGRSRERKER